MIKNKVLFFDLDDTLIKCSGYYYEIEDKVAQKILEYSDKYKFKEIKEMFNTMQANNLIEHGYGPENFRISLMQIASEIIGYNFFKDNISEYIKELTEPLYDSPIELLDDVEETIDYLYNKGYEMYIITKGMKDVQKRRVEKLSINHYFKDYEIVKHKEKSDYIEILKKLKLEPEICYMIGNSPKGDINEAKQAGLNTIYIPSKYTWGCENEEISKQKPETKILSRISEIKNIL